MQYLESLLVRAERGEADLPANPAIYPALWTLAGLFGVVIASMLVLAANELWSAWLSGDWRTFWLTAGAPFRFMPFYLFPLWMQVFTRSAPNRRELYQQWREAVRAGDAQVAPLAAHQPEPFADDDVRLGRVYIGPLRGLRTKRSASAVIGAILLFATAAVSGACAVWALLAEWPRLATVLAYRDFVGLLTLSPAEVFCCLCAGSLIWGLMVARRIRHLHQPLVIVATDEGIEWVDPLAHYAQRRVRWNEMRALARITYRRQTDYTKQRIYLLDALLEGDEYTLLWRTDNLAEPAEHEASKRLAALIARHANVPLRDVSESAGQLSTALVSAAKPATRTAVPAPRETGARRGGSAVGQTRPVGLSKRQRAVATVAGVVVLALFSVMGGAMVMQRAQPGYYAGIERQILAARPLFADALTQDDGEWPVAARQSPGRQSETFSGGAYHLTGGAADMSIDVETRGSYGAAAVEVTARERGHSANDGVGLVLRERLLPNGQQQEVVFQVTEDSNWSLYLLDEPHRRADDGWVWLAGGHSDALRAGEGAANTLLVVMRGDQYICYINGRWVGGQTDDTLSSGAAGVYVNDATTEGIFSDFRVYPVARSGFGLGVIPAVDG